MDRDKISAKPRIIVVFFIVVTLVGLALAETAARLAFTYKRQIAPTVNPQKLNWYEMVDPNDPRNWKLRPGTTLTFKKLLEAKRARGAVLADRDLERLAEKHYIEESSVVFHVNSQGYKGPELRPAPEIRVLTLGDSCTFGDLIDRFAYARVLERRLETKGFDVEVINAGVAGYTPWNILLRIDEFKKLKPDVVTLYIGWNAMFEFTSIRQERWLQSPLLFQAAWNRMYAKAVGEQRAALADYNRGKRVDMNSEEVKRLSRYEPPFLGEVEKIVKEMQRVRAHVVLVTLPGLFVTTEWPNEHALKIGHLPVYTDNPFVFATITERYNQALRKLADASNINVVDLEEWSGKALRPRDTYFIDSVHLTAEGQEMIGKYMADQLVQFHPNLFR